MFRVFEFILHGCWHKWRKAATIQLYGDGFGRMTDMPTGYKIRYECDKCGRIKERRI